MRTHIFEPELNASPPRAVKSRDGFRAGCGLWVGRMFLMPHTIAGIFILGVAIVATVNFTRVWWFGEECEGRIVKKIQNKSKSGPTYKFAYQYQLCGATRTGEAWTSEAHFAETPEGQPITVRALESDPELDPWPRTPGYWALRELGVKWLVAAFWNGILSLFLWMVYVLPWRMRELIRLGVPTEGIIREVTKSVNKGTTNYRMRYEYAVPALDGSRGQTLTGRMTSIRKDAALAKVGDVVTVLFYPSKPKRSLIYRYAAYRAA